MTVTVYTDPETIQRIDQEIATATRAVPGAKMSRAAWAAQRIREHFEAIDKKKGAPRRA